LATVASYDCYMFIVQAIDWPCKIDGRGHLCVMHKSD